MIHSHCPRFPPKSRFDTQPYLDVFWLSCRSKSFLPKHTDILSQTIKALLWIQPWNSLPSTPRWEPSASALKIKYTANTQLVGEVVYWRIYLNERRKKKLFFMLFFFFFFWKKKRGCGQMLGFAWERALHCTST